MRVLLLLGFLLVPHLAFAAGAYIVDDTDIVDAGKIQSESWYTHGGRVADIGNINLAYQFFPRTEITLQETHAFQPGSQDLVTPQIKYLWYKSDNGIFAGSLIANMVYPTFQTRGLSPSVYAPVSVTIAEKLEIDANFGWQYENQTGRHFAIWGLGEKYQMTPLWSLISDVFGRNTDTPGLQLGPHLTANENIEFDLVYGRNIYGKQENSGTLGMTLTF